MAELVPAIIAKDFADLKKKIRAVEPFVETVQLDIMDGVFVPNKTFNSPDELKNLETGLFLEVHLMVEHPERVLGGWLNSQVKRVILHWEAIKDIHLHDLIPFESQMEPKFPVSNLARIIKNADKEFGVALNPKTPISVLDSFIVDFDLVLVMSVNPGFSGQEFLEDSLQKIFALRQKSHDVKIGVDGGINLQNIKRVVQAGADCLVINSAIFESEKIGEAINNLTKLI